MLNWGGEGGWEEGIKITRLLRGVAKKGKGGNSSQAEK